MVGYGWILHDTSITTLVPPSSRRFWNTLLTLSGPMPGGPNPVEQLASLAAHEAPVKLHRPMLACWAPDSPSIHLTGPSPSHWFQCCRWITPSGTRPWWRGWIRSLLSDAAECQPQHVECQIHIDSSGTRNDDACCLLSQTSFDAHLAIYERQANPLTSQKLHTPWWNRPSHWLWAMPLGLVILCPPYPYLSFIRTYDSLCKV